MPSDAIKLPARKPRKKNETTGLVVPVLAALNAFDWCQVFRNNTGALEDRNGRLVRYGLCDGSADVVGMVRFGVCCHELCPMQAPEHMRVGRFFALELKMPGNKPTESQLAFLDLVRRFGGFAAWADSLDGAVAAAQRARDPRWDR